MLTPPAIVLQHVSVNFGGVRALHDISFDIERGCTFGIIGPNGAGKTTLFNCITGFLIPSAGSDIQLDGRSILKESVNAIARMGVARTFQNISLSKTNTARENILAGMHLALGYGPLAALLPGRRVRQAEAEAMRRIEQVADDLGISAAVLDSRVSSLSLGTQKKIEVARALVRSPKTLFLDEPAGGLNDSESAELLAALSRLAKSNRELTIVLIDHDMNFVMPLCDRIAVLNFGQLVTVGTPGAVSRNPDVIACYMGSTDAT